MLAVGMLPGPVVVYLLLAVILGHASPLPLQVLPSIPGYIPVYIRHGDEPLIEINPALAEAFHEDLNVPKNLPLDNGADLSIDEIEGNGFLGRSRKNGGILKVRKAGNGTRTRVDEKTTSKDAGVGPSKILPYELHDKRYLRDGHQRRKPGSREPPVKVSPLTDEEKDLLEQYRVYVERLEAQENSHQESSDRSKMSRDFTPDAPVQATTSRPPRVRLMSSANRKREPPTKVQPARIFGNVRKLLPADVREGTIITETTPKMETNEPRSDNKTR